MLMIISKEDSFFKMVFVGTMPAKSLGTLDVIYAIDEL